VLKGHERVEKGFHINENGVFTASDEVFIMKIGGFQGVKDCQVYAEPFVKLVHLLFLTAGCVRNKLHPTVPGTLHEEGLPQPHTQRFVKPCTKCVEVRMQRPLSGYVHHLFPVFQGHDTDRGPLVLVAQVGFDTA